MTRVKRIFWVLSVIAVSLIFVMTGAVSAGKYEGQTITVLAADHPGFNGLIDLASDFEKAYGIKIKFDIVDQGSIWTKVALTAGTGNYDVLMVDSMQVAELINLSVLEPLNKYVNDQSIAVPDFDFADVMPSYIELFTYNKNIYAFPLSGETALYFYRKDLYEKYGRKPAKTMEELMKDMAFFNGREPGLYGHTAHAIDAQSMMILMWHFGGRFFVGDDPHAKLVINSKENRAAWKFYADSIKYLPPGFTAYGYDMSASMFQQLKVATYIDASNISFLLDPKYSKLTKQNMGWALIPLAKGVTKRASVVCGWGLAVAKGSTHKEAAFKLVEYQLTKAIDKLLAKSRMPNRLSSYADPAMVAAYPYLPIVAEALKTANADFLPRIPECVEIWNLLGEEVKLIAAKQETPTKALQKLQASIYAVMEKAGYYKK